LTVYLFKHTPYISGKKKLMLTRSDNKHIPDYMYQLIEHV